MKSTLEGLGIPGTPEFSSDKTSSVIRHIVVDFLFRLKDKFPVYYTDEGYKISFVNEIIETMHRLKLKPSKELQQEYLNCELNRKLNELPSLEYLNAEFQDKMEIGVYEVLKRRFDSRPPYNFYLNADIELERYNKYIGEHFIGMRAWAYVRKKSWIYH